MWHSYNQRGGGGGGGGEILNNGAFNGPKMIHTRKRTLDFTNLRIGSTCGFMKPDKIIVVWLLYKCSGICTYYLPLAQLMEHLHHSGA